MGIRYTNCNLCVYHVCAFRLTSENLNWVQRECFKCAYTDAQGLFCLYLVVLKWQLSVQYVFTG